VIIKVTKAQLAHAFLVANETDPNGKRKLGSKSYWRSGYERQFIGNVAECAVANFLEIEPTYTSDWLSNKCDLVYRGATINVKGTSRPYGNLITDESAYIQEKILVLVRGVQLDSMYEQSVDVAGWCLTRDHQTDKRVRTLKGVEKHFTASEMLWAPELLWSVHAEEEAA
jgi:hypothetical protein